MDKRNERCLQGHTISFGEFLIENGLITQADYSAAIELQRFQKRKLGRLLVDLEILSTSDLDKALLAYLRPRCALSIHELKEKLSTVPKVSKDLEFLKVKRMLPVYFGSDYIHLISDSFSDVAIEAAEIYFEKLIHLEMVPTEIFTILSTSGSASSVQNGKITLAEELSSDELLQAHDPYAFLVHECLQEAKRLGASDIHIEPYDTECLIRFRVHGILSDWKNIAREHTQTLIARFKFLLNMDLALVSAPQDSRATFHGLGIDVRANSMPVTSGNEKIVMRLQYNNRTIPISKLGLSPEQLHVLLDSITKSDGLVLISGPTGSGKTTTLYALIEEMDRLGKNICTLENPVEKQLPRVNQANIFDHQDFPSFQRALMRQDPDVILLGEIRDPQTADLSMKLASTGHLVLSTVHANGAAEVIDRLQNLGVDTYSIRSNLRLSVAQRLLRILCRQCSLEAPNDLIKKLQEVKNSDFKVTNPHGCSSCHKGATGRIAVIEYLEKHEIEQMGTAKALVRRTLADECAALARKGVVDISDALHHA